MELLQRLVNPGDEVEQLLGVHFFRRQLAQNAPIV